MPDMLKTSKDEEHRKRDEAQLYNIQQQIDELRRQFREAIARQQWFEELYRQSEGKVTQVQMSQDRLAQDVAQHLSARDIGEGRMKAQIADLAQRIESPDKQIREIRSQFQELSNVIKTGREGDAADRKQFEDIWQQVRELHSAIGRVTDGQRQMRDLMHDLDAAIGEVRQEASHIAELQRIEEQRLRRQGIELQEMVESLRQQFTELAAKSQRVDDVRRQLVERIEAIEELASTLRSEDQGFQKDMEHIEKIENEHYLAQQERIETLRVQVEAQLAEMRQVADQRLDRYGSRFASTEERIRAVEQLLSEIPSRFDALERRDETIGAEADTIEEWLVVRQIAALENVLEEVRKRRVERAPMLKPRNTGAPGSPQQAPGSVYNPAGLLKSVKDAKPPTRKDDADGPAAEGDSDD